MLPGSAVARLRILRMVRGHLREPPFPPSGRLHVRAAVCPLRSTGSSVDSSTCETRTDRGGAVSPAYVIFTEAINDPSGMAKYGEAAAPTLAEWGATVLVVDGRPQVLEGTWHGSQTVILEFPSIEIARAWYESAAYTEAKRLRHGAAETNAVIVEGFSMRPQRP